ncbi:hypothetical protein OF83DRAFT_92279 [Amylostereum chailletii]|nr:hypothetical protein OF83DRAFT_92279 [Amylostereum chailletii]
MAPMLAAGVPWSCAFSFSMIAISFNHQTGTSTKDTCLHLHVCSILGPISQVSNGQKQENPRNYIFVNFSETKPFSISEAVAFWHYYQRSMVLGVD